MKYNISIKDKEAKSNLKYVFFIGIFLLLVIGVVIAQIGLFNINNLNNLRLGENLGESDLVSEPVDVEQISELGEQITSTSDNNRISDINKNNIIENEN